MTSERNDPSEDKKEKKQKRLIIILIILLLIALLFCGTFVGYIVYNEIGKDDPGAGGTGVTIDPNIGEIDKPTTISKPGVAVPGWESVTIPANTLTVTDVPFYNPEENEGLYYLTFKLCLIDDNGKESDVIFTTGYVPPGKKISSVTLNSALSPGTYNAVLHVQPYRIEDETTTNNVASRITLIVK